ncbi:ABC transporter substrate-binding protein [Rarobacter faecitabidus]|uniref:Amino acid/amide ABC transporter substrate-binding protein (HAAT family) n=1 Tax=Rarobacter faecitabidus TaxID=13243 RepID=A0A542Z8I6_RARFA|nr:ABC transporter substrate-binding protein [Rarobacter faecitabidus]TQL56659.1 amino acid/amide ABC transporter substrate-binding protein (HAAT family) [Rarobacter faecitabidus]
MSQRKTLTAGVALLAAATLALTGCSSDSTSSTATSTGTETPAATSDALVVGTLLPVTGTLAFLGPPEVAGVGLAVEDINEAGGVLGKDVSIVAADSGDSTDMNVSTQGATELISKKANVVIGAASSSVSLNVVDQITEAGIMMISPANTSTTLSGYSPLYSRTAPPDTVQGAALGSAVLDAGHTKVGILVQNEDYGTGLRDNVQKAIEAGGGEVVYGATGGGQEFPPGESNFASYVSELLAAKPDTIVIVAFEETVAIIQALLSAGWDASNVFLCDGNTADYSENFDAGTLEGALGTIPGAQAPEDFQKRLSDWHETNEGAALKDFSYGPESYDATILAALAAVRGGATDGQTIADNLRAVSGSEEGSVEVTTYADGVAALAEGKEIAYKGVAGIGPINEQMDPSSAYIGVYKFDADNKPVFDHAVEGKI